MTPPIVSPSDRRLRLAQARSEPASTVESRPAECRGRDRRATRLLGHARSTDAWILASSRSSSRRLGGAVRAPMTSRLDEMEARQEAVDDGPTLRRQGDPRATADPPHRADRVTKPLALVRVDAAT